MNTSKFDFSFQDIVEFAKDVIVVTKADPIDDPGPEIVYVNQAFTELTGYSKDDVIGKNPRILQSHGTDEETKKKIREGLEQKTPVRVTIKNYSKTGEEYWLDLSVLPLKNKEGEVTHFVAIERDVTEQKNIEKKLLFLSKTDPLTALLNRRSFEEILENELSRFKRSDEIYSLLMFDIDNFKQINDNYGHAVGDTVIQTIAKSCQSILRLQDKAARIGGEEFCVILPSTTKNVALAVAEKLRENVANLCIPTTNEDIRITISLGVSEIEEGDSEHTAIIKRADEKMYEAKKSGKNRVC